MYEIIVFQLELQENQVQVLKIDLLKHYFDFQLKFYLQFVVVHQVLLLILYMEKRLNFEID